MKLRNNNPQLNQILQFNNKQDISLLNHIKQKQNNSIPIQDRHANNFYLLPSARKHIRKLKNLFMKDSQKQAEQIKKMFDKKIYDKLVQNYKKMDDKYSIYITDYVKGVMKRQKLRSSSPNFKRGNQLLQIRKNRLKTEVKLPNCNKKQEDGIIKNKSTVDKHNKTLKTLNINRNRIQQTINHENMIEYIQRKKKELKNRIEQI